MFTLRSLFVAGLTALPLAVLPAQETEQRRNPADREQPGRAEARTLTQDGKGSGQLDKYFVSCLKTDNKAEVAIATFAAQKATNPDVKAFAQQMVKDHTDLLAKLDRFDQASPATTRDNNSAGAANRDDTKPRADRTDSAANPPKARADVRVDVKRGDATAQASVRGTRDIANQLLQVKQEITDRCVASAQRELGQKQGKEFDQCYMFMQVGAHIHMVDTLTVLNSHASPELQQVIDEALHSVQQHLEHAKQIAKKLDDSSTAASDDRADEKTTATKTARKSTD